MHPLVRAKVFTLRQGFLLKPQSLPSAGGALLGGFNLRNVGFLYLPPSSSEEISLID